MSNASSSVVEDMSIPPRHADIGYFKCVSCGMRYWQKNKLVRRSAKCKGVWHDQDGIKRKCKAWRCRYNDQCTGANAACPLCGAFKPPEFLPTQPAHACSPAHSPRPFSPANATRAPASLPSDRLHTIPPARYLHEQPDHSSVQNLTSVNECIVPRGTITQLPLLEGMTQRFLTEV